MSSSILASGTGKLRSASRTRHWERSRRIGTALSPLALLIAVTVLGPALAPSDPEAVDMSRRLQPPSREHPMGTDPLGRDVLSRVLAGARVSLPSVLVVVASAAGLGVVLGAVATGFALVAALLNAVFGFCLGCEMYLLIRRFGPASKTAGSPRHDPVHAQV